MGLSHLEPAYTDKAGDLIEEFGGKLGGLQYLLAADPAFAHHILPMQIVKPGETYTQTPSGRNLIARASHPHDFQGLVNVIDSTSFSTVEQKIGDVIEAIRAAALDDVVMKYGQYENPAYDGRVTVGIQPHYTQDTLRTKEYRRGSVIEHPNYPGQYLIEWVEEWRGLGGPDRDLTSGLYDADGNQIKEYNLFIHPPKNATDLVRLYQKIRAAELVKDDITFQMEFGSAPTIAPLVYQIRGFMRKSAPSFVMDDEQAWYSSLAMGTTPESGITLPVVVQGRDSPQCPDTPVAILTPRPTDWRNLEFMPTHIGAYLGGGSHGRSACPNMQHGNFWKAQKADVTVFEGRGARLENLVEHPGRLRDAEEKLHTGKVHILSDGLRAIVTPVE